MTAAGGRCATGRGEAGFALPAVLGLGGVLVSLALAGTAGGQVLVAHRRAAAVADLSALAGAVAAQHAQDPCAAAGRLAELQRAELSACQVEGERVRVTAEVSLTLAGREMTVRARAHAGPRSAG